MDRQKAYFGTTILNSGSYKTIGAFAPKISCENRLSHANACSRWY